ncbi:MAG: D-glycerate dehydrogenase [Alphaproteobacteria bacterium]|nr:D-glycerate dehydrogenase [Alphaproteobacteria bacterium]
MPDKPTILVTRKMPPAVEARLRRDYRPTLNPDDRIPDAEALIAASAGMDGLLVAPSDKVTATAIGRLPASVKIVATFSVGYDHIDLQAAGARGLVVTNTPDVLNDCTAEVAVMLMLGAAHRAYEGGEIVRHGDWSQWGPTYLLSTELRAKKLGILGMGRIGQRVAHLARAFGMAIHYSNRTRLAPALEQGATFHAHTDDLLRQSEYLSIHAPLTPDTRHWLDARRIGLLPPGAIVVNTARGPIVDDGALIAALKSGRVAAAGLDVFEGEPRNVNRGYFDLPNAFLLPHLGSASLETRTAMGMRAVDNLDAFFAGKKPGDRLV